MANINSDFDKPKIVTITGGGSGIGASTAQYFLDKGHKVYVLSRNPCDLTEQGSSTRCDKAHFLNCDVRFENQVKLCFEKIGFENGGINVAINCSGILDQMRSTELSCREFEDVLKTNLTGTWLCMKYQIPEMKKKSAGSIVNISSIFGFKGSPYNCAYVASKHGIIGLTKTFALEYAEDNIRTNCVAPSYTDTPMLQRALSTSLDKKQKILNMLPKNKFINANEVSKTIYWLACDAPTSINGHCLVVDDGYTSGSKI